MFGPYGTFMQTWAALCLLLFFVALFSLTQPYEQIYLNHLERSALSVNCVTLLFGLGLFTNDQASEARNPALAVILSAAIVILNVIFVINVIIALRDHGQHCSRCRKTKSVVASGVDLAVENTVVLVDEEGGAPRNVAFKRLVERASNVKLMAPLHRRRSLGLSRKDTRKGSLRYTAKVALHMKTARINVAAHRASFSSLQQQNSLRKIHSRNRLQLRIMKRKRSRMTVNETQCAVMPACAGGRGDGDRGGSGDVAVSRPVISKAKAKHPKHPEKHEGRPDYATARAFFKKLGRKRTAQLLAKLTARVAKRGHGSSDKLLAALLQKKLEVRQVEAALAELRRFSEADGGGNRITAGGIMRWAAGELE
jgi:hypothetical protein